MAYGKSTKGELSKVGEAATSEQGDGRVVPTHGKGWLKPVQKGQVLNPTGSKGSEYHQTVMLARKAGVEAIQGLIKGMRSHDERIATISRQAVLERAFGKPKEMSEETHRAFYDLGKLPKHVLAALVELVQGGHIRPVSDEIPAQDEIQVAATEAAGREIEGKAE